MAIDITTPKLKITDILKELNINDQKQPLTISQKSKLEKFLRQPFDFTNATSDELDNYSKALELYKNSDVGVSKEQNISADIYDYVKSLNEDNSNPLNVGTRLTDDQIRKTADVAANKLVQGNLSRADIYNLLDSFTGKRGYNSTIASRIQSTYEPKVQEYKDTGTYDDSLANTEKTIKELLNQRNEIGATSDYVNQFLQNAPKELAAQTGEYYGTQRSKAKDYLKNVFIPGLVQNYNKTGVEFGRGEFNDLVSQKAYQLEQAISTEQLGQQSQDALVFADMAYKKTLQDLANARGDVKSQTAYDFQTARQKQINQYTSSQANINKEFDLNLFRQENKNALQAYQTKLKKQQEESDKANEAGIYGGIANAIATGTTAGVVNKIGSSGGGGWSQPPKQIG
jgi:hypothetical protein